MSKRKKEEDDLFIEFEDEEIEEIDLSIKKIEEVDGIRLPMGWGQSVDSIDEVIKHRQSFNLKHGLYANVPMVCKGTECPFHTICTVPLRKRPVFERCPIEIAAILDRNDKYVAELGIGPEDYLDQSQVKDLVDIEIKLMRTNGHLAISGNFIEQVVQAIDEKGNEITRPELHKATEYEERLLNRKRQILSELNATRKSKKHEGPVAETSSYASELMRKANMAKRQIIDVDYTEDDNVNDDSVKSDTATEKGDDQC